MAVNPEQLDLIGLMQQKERVFRADSGVALVKLARDAFDRREYREAWAKCESAEEFLGQGTTQFGELLLLRADILDRTNPSDAEDQYRKAKAEIAPAIGAASKRLLAKICKHFGIHLRRIKRWEKAETELRIAGETYGEQGDKPEAAECYIEIYRVAAEKKGWLRDFENCRSLAKRLGLAVELCLLALRAHHESLCAPSVAKRAETTPELLDSYWSGRFREAREKWESGSRPF